MIRVALSLLAAGLLFCLQASAQPRFAGKVVEALDGRTLVIEANTGRMTVQLQYIEVPEADQQFSTVVREHLAKLTVGQVVEFQPVRLGSTVSVGRVMLRDVDLSLQMIRDGASWHELVDLSGQSAESAREYASNQEQAKSEKRGIWSMPNLKTPAQLRVEREAALAKAEAEEKSKRATKVGLGLFLTQRRPGTVDFGAQFSGTNLNAWADVFAGVGTEAPGLKTYTDPQGRFDVIYTSGAFVELGSGNKKHRLECRLMYILVKAPDGRRQIVYLLGFRSLAENYYFSKRNSSLTLSAAKRTYAVGRPFGSKAEASFATQELFFYRIPPAALKGIARSESVEVKIDVLSGRLSTEMLDEFKQLAAAAAF